MFVPFSSGYYLTRMKLKPYYGDKAVISDDTLQRINIKYDLNDSEITNMPVVMKVENIHFKVHGDEDTENGRLRIPMSLTRRLSDDIHDSVEKEVLLAKTS